MPTPESAAFLAKKPTVPPTFDGVDYDDNRRLKQAQDAIVREQWVRCMMARLVREELGKCYRREGINHLLNCGKLRERYLELLQDAKVKGYLFQQQNYVPKDSKYASSSSSSSSSAAAAAGKPSPAPPTYTALPR